MRGPAGAGAGRNCSATKSIAWPTVSSFTDSNPKSAVNE